MTSKCSSKFSPEIKLFLSELKGEENPRVKILTRINNILEPDHKSQMEAIGAEIRTVASDIVTLVIPARALHVLAMQDFVKYIELTRPLYGELEDIE